MRKIIIIDDSRIARLHVRDALDKAQYEVIEAADGNEGLAAMAAHPDAHLVLCDINMPAMNGFEMLEQTPAATRASMAFLMLTTEAEPRLIQRAKELGAKGWIVKPFKPALLAAAVTKLVG